MKNEIKLICLKGDENEVLQLCELMANDYRIKKQAKENAAKIAALLNCGLSK